MSKNFRYSGDHDFEEYHREKNKKCTKALLAALIEHHGEPSSPQEEAEPIELVPAVVEAPPPKRKTAMELWLDSFEPIAIPQNYPTIASIKKGVAEYFGVTVMEIDSSRRDVKVVRPRQIGYYLAKKLTPRSMPDIGRKFGSRDHTSVLHGIRKIERLRRANPKLEADLHALATSLGGSLA